MATESSDWLIMGKTMSPRWRLQFWSDFVKVAGNEDRQNISDEFEFRPDRTTPFGVRYPWASTNFPYTCNGENGVSMLARSFFIGPSSNLLVIRTDIKSPSDEFDFRPDRISHFGVTCPWLEHQKSPYTLILSNMNFSKTSWPVLVKFYVYHHWHRWKADLGFGTDWIKPVVVLATKNTHWLIMGKMVSPLFLNHFIGSSPNLQVSKTGVKSQMSSNSNQTGSFTSVSRTIEHRKNSYIL